MYTLFEEQNKYLHYLDVQGDIVMLTGYYIFRTVITI